MKRDPTKVDVHIYDDCDVDCEAVNLSKTAMDQIEWHSTGDEFIVEFKGHSPFAEKRFEVSRWQSAQSGPVVDGEEDFTYRYEIRKKGSGAAAADPDVNVKK